jgi:hypothetical protein
MFPTISSNPSSVKIQKEKSLQHRKCEHFSLHDLIALAQRTASQMQVVNRTSCHARESGWEGMTANPR